MRIPRSAHDHLADRIARLLADHATRRTAVGGAFGALVPVGALAAEKPKRGKGGGDHKGGGHGKGHGKGKGKGKRPGNGGADGIGIASLAPLRLLQRYRLNRPSGSPWYDGIRLRPGGFVNNANLGIEGFPNSKVTNVGAYGGWDFIQPGYNHGTNLAATNANFFEVWLRSQATVAVVIRSGTPHATCFNSWTDGGTVQIDGASKPVRKKQFNAGLVEVCGVNSGAGSGSRQTPLILIGNHDGSAPASTPATANQTCPSGDHGSGWHGQLDPGEWCYWRHDHGDNPDLFASSPASNRVFGEPALIEGMNEPHVGHKVAVTQRASTGTEAPKEYRWKFIYHAGSAGEGRTCERHHTWGAALMDPANGNLLMDFYALIDTGPARENDNGQYITHTNCPNQGPEEDETSPNGASRKMADGTGNPSYEPWTFGVVGTTEDPLAIKFLAEWLVNTYGAQTKCQQTITAQNGNCTMIQNLGNVVDNSGMGRFIQCATFGVDLSGMTSQQFTAKYGSSGWFCTDAFGSEDSIVPVGAGGNCASDQVKQFISPSLAGKKIMTGANRIQQPDDGGFGDLMSEATTGTEQRHPPHREYSIRNDAQSWDKN